MKKVVMFLRLIITIPLVAIGFVPTALLAFIFGFSFRILRLKKLGEVVPQAILTVTVHWIMFFLGSKLVILGKENLPAKGEKYCFTPNHCSMVDIPALYCTGRWPGMISKKEAWRIPGLHALLHLLHCVKIDRASPKDAIKAIQSGANNIRNGIPMVIFPEGTRSKTGEIGRFKSGSFKMGFRAKAKIVPVVLKNTRACLESASHFRRVTVYVQILPPIDTSEMELEDTKAVPEMVENMVKEAYDKLPVSPKKK